MKMDVNKWTAEKCDITVRGLDARYAIPQYSFIYNDKVFYYEWTMQDARCRNIFWEWWLMNNKGYVKATRSDLDAYIVSVQKGADIKTSRNGYKKSLDEADYECIEAIMKAENQE